MSTQFVRIDKRGRRTKRMVANRWFGGTARGCVVDWFKDLPDEQVLRGDDGSRVTVAELRSWEGRGRK